MKSRNNFRNGKVLTLKNFIPLLVTIVIVLQKLSYIKCDLPVHCLKHDIIGTWMIHATNLMSVKSAHDMNCGHDEPSREGTSFTASSIYPFVNDYKLVLKGDDAAELVLSSVTYTGNWTMVYDEGFNIEFQQFSFFAFSKYTIENSYQGYKVFKSKCYSTCVGWYSNADKSKRGCYKAIKVGVDPNKDTYINTKKMSPVIQPNYNLIDKNVNSYAEYQRYKSISFIAEKERLETVSMSENLNSNFNQHHLYVQKLNAIPNKLFEATVYSEFNHKSLSELNKFAGFPRFKEKTLFSNSKTKGNLNPTLMPHFPINFDWRSLLRPAASQGDCGSCYAIATTRMMEAKLKLLYNHDISLSVQHALDCSYYNQGCDGGYPFLVMKFANEFEMIPEFCQPYKNFDGQCLESCNLNSLDYIYKVTNYRYVGGSYGRCSEKAMMEELYHHGPFVVSFEPDYNFMFYKTGIYHSLDLGSWQNQGLPKPEWEKVDHSVLLVGWGEDPLTREQFWLLQNSWGPQWGEGGFFRIKRGVDEFAIESICETGTPIIVDNKTKLPIIPDKNTMPRTDGNTPVHRNRPMLRNGPIIFNLNNFR